MVILQTALNLTRLTSPRYNNTTSMHTEYNKIQKIEEVNQLNRTNTNKSTHSEWTKWDEAKSGRPWTFEQHTQSVANTTD